MYMSRRIAVFVALFAAALLPVRGFAAPIAAAIMADCPQMAAMAQIHATSSVVADSASPCEHCNDASDTVSNSHPGHDTALKAKSLPTCDQACSLCTLACGVVVLDAAPHAQPVFASALAAAGHTCESFASAERHLAFKPPIFCA
jgi:hypothetical protein